MTGRGAETSCLNGVRICALRDRNRNRRPRLTHVVRSVAAVALLPLVGIRRLSQTLAANGGVCYDAAAAVHSSQRASVGLASLVYYSAPERPLTRTKTARSCEVCGDRSCHFVSSKQALLTAWDAEFREAAPLSVSSSVAKFAVGQLGLPGSGARCDGCVLCVRACVRVRARSCVPSTTLRPQSEEQRQTRAPADSFV